jgi:hypothetical protein
MNQPLSPRAHRLRALLVSLALPSCLMGDTAATGGRVSP